ncbi:MAG: hypothetical protein ABI811_01720 [Acidobacteriota bacterium]
MQTFRTALKLASIAGAFVAFASMMFASAERVTVCHETGHGRIVIEVAPQAVPAHLAHGDQVKNPDTKEFICDSPSQ